MTDRYLAREEIVATALDRRLWEASDGVTVSIWYENGGWWWAAESHYKGPYVSMHDAMGDAANFHPDCTFKVGKPTPNGPVAGSRPI